MKQYPKNSNLILIVSLLIGWLYDFLFWMKPVGVNFSILTTACLLGGFGLMLANRFRPNAKSLWLLIPFFSFAAITSLRQEPLTVLLAYTFSLFSLGVMANTYLSGRWMQYILPDYITKFFTLIGSMLLKPIEFNTWVREERKERGETAEVSVGAIVRGLALALPVVLCFASLLSSADFVFEQKVKNFLDFFSFNDISETLERIIKILIFAYLLAGVYLHIFSYSKDEKLAGEDKPVYKKILGFTESSIVMGSVSILFLFFVIIQFQYFFGGQTNIGVTGYSYSQYARRGFSELNIVAFFSLLLIFGLNAFTSHTSEKEERIYSGMSIFMVTLVLVILISSYQRLGLAIDWHGYSRLRLYPRTFLIWLGILLVAVVMLQAFRRERYFAFAFVVASIGFAVSLALLNVDRAIVLHNVSRYLQGKNLNVGHLSSLSVDAIPALMEEFQNPNYPAELHEGIGATLLCYFYSDAIVDDTSFEDWRSFNLSKWQAHMDLNQIEHQLESYQILKKRNPMIVRTPGNVRYECGEYLGEF